MNKYIELSDFEINKAVAEKHGYHWYWSNTVGKPPIMVNGYIFDPCNSIEQAWEIMMKYNIFVTKDEEIFEAYSSLVIDNGWVAGVSGIAYHQKPLVAAMLCFLEM